MTKETLFKAADRYREGKTKYKKPVEMKKFNQIFKNDPALLDEYKASRGLGVKKKK